MYILCRIKGVVHGSAVRFDALTFQNSPLLMLNNLRMYRLMVDRLAQIGYTVASVGYRVYPDGDINAQVTHTLEIPSSRDV